MTLELRMEHSKIVIFDIGMNSADEIHEHKSRYQISIPLQTEGILYNNNAYKKVSNGYRLVTTPGSTHRHEAGENPLRIMLIDIDEKFLNEQLKDFYNFDGDSSIEFQPWSTHTSERFIQLGQLALQHFQNQNTDDHLSLSEIEMEIAKHLIEHQDGSHQSKLSPIFTQSNFYKNENVGTIIDYIHENLEEDLSLYTLSIVGNINKYHLIESFKKDTGFTPSQYIRDVRIKKAAFLLKDTDQNILAIAHNVGFMSLSTFNRVFKAKYSVSPSQYRKEVK